MSWIEIDLACSIYLDAKFVCTHISGMFVTKFPDLLNMMLNIGLMFSISSHCVSHSHNYRLSSSQFPIAFKRELSIDRSDACSSCRQYHQGLICKLFCPKSIWHLFFMTSYKTKQKELFVKITETIINIHTAGSDTIFVQIYMDTLPGVQGVSKNQIFFFTNETVFLLR